jgi:presenilin-like A22 family membrane protease
LSEKYKPKLVYLIPVGASLLVGLICAVLLMPLSTDFISFTPFSESTAAGPLPNAIYFVVLIAIGGTLMYFLIKRKHKKIVNSLIVFAITVAALMLSLVYVSLIFLYFPTIDFLTIPVSIILTVLYVLAIFRFGNNARNTAVIILGGALGMFFAIAIPFYSGVLILIFLAAYDVFAVYKGPIGKLAASSALDELKGLTFSFKEIQMGLGDLVFYSMLIGIFFFTYGFLSCLFAVLGVLIGSYLTFVMLQKRGIFPGLPFPIIFGLLAGLLVGLLI